jgi:hypothetical protein
MRKLLVTISILAMGLKAYGAACIQNLAPPTASNQICVDTSNQTNFIDPVAGQVTLNTLENPASVNLTNVLKVSGTSIYPPASQNINAVVTPISPTASFIMVISTASLTYSANVAIATATATNGQYLLLASTSSVNNVQIATGTATGVIGDNPFIVISSTVSAIGFVYNSTISQWMEVGRQ